MTRQRSHSRRDLEQRSALAQQAARLIVDEGVRDPLRAVRKAAERAGLRDPAGWPDLAEIEQAVRAHQRLFASERQPTELRRRREAALEAMRFLSRWRPRLVGAVLDGSADRHSAVELQLFADDPDAVLRWLPEQGLPHRLGERELRYRDGRRERITVARFLADDIEFELQLLPLGALREAPLDRSGERAIARATVAEVERLLDDA